MTKRKVIIRADGAQNIGFGHVYRMIALIEMIKDDFDCLFVSHTFPDFLRHELKQLEVPFLLIQSICYPSTEFRIKHHEVEFDMDGILNGNEIVVIDGYWFGINFQSKIKSLGCTLVCIDDLAQGTFNADLIINHAPGIHPNNYSCISTTQFALGSSFALLRNVFLKKIKTNNLRNEISTVLICFGGSDNKNLTEKTLKVAKSFRQFKRIIIVTGPGYNYKENLSLEINNDESIMYEKEIDGERMCTLMIEADLAIVPSSGILLEALANVPRVISGKYVENQNNLYTNYLKMNAFYDAKDFNKKSLSSAIREAFSDNTEPTLFIDGNSSTNILKLFKKLNLLHEIEIRRATINDLETTFSWAQDNTIRKFSFNQNLIKKEEHHNWFSQMVDSIACYYYIAEKNMQAIGSIRFNILNNVARISYLIDSNHHGLGYGNALLTNGIIRFRKDIQSNSKHIPILQGEVLKSNTPSIKIFENLGFTKKDEGINYKFELKI